MSRCGRGRMLRKISGDALTTDCVEGKEHGEDGSAMAFFLAAAEAQGSVVPIDDLSAYPEAEPGAVDSFGRIEGLEYAAKNLSGDTAAGVCHGDYEAGPASVPVSADAAAQQ